MLHLSALLIFKTPGPTVCSMKSPKGVPSFSDYHRGSKNPAPSFVSFRFVFFGFPFNISGFLALLRMVEPEWESSVVYDYFKACL